MAKTKQEVNPKSADRLKQLYRTRNITQFWLSEKTGISQNTLSRIANGKAPLSHRIAGDIIELFPDIRAEWLMGEDDFQTEMDKLKNAIGNLHDTYGLITQLMALHGYTFKEVDLSKCSEFEKSIYGETAVDLRNSKGKVHRISYQRWRRIIGEIDRFVEFEFFSIFKEEEHNG